MLPKFYYLFLFLRFFFFLLIYLVRGLFTNHTSSFPFPHFNYLYFLFGKTRYFLYEAWGLQIYFICWTFLLSEGFRFDFYVLRLATSKTYIFSSQSPFLLCFFFIWFCLEIGFLLLILDHSSFNYGLFSDNFSLCISFIFLELASYLFYFLTRYLCLLI